MAHGDWRDHTCGRIAALLRQDARADAIGVAGGSDLARPLLEVHTVLMFFAEQVEQTGLDAAAWIAVGAAPISLIAVGVAAWQARLARLQATAAELQAEESRRQADAAVRQTDLQEQVQRDAGQPYVWTDFRIDVTQGELIRLVVKNEGPTVARNVRITFTPPLQTAGTRALDAVQQRLSDGLPSMPPGREMVWAFAVGHVLFAEDSRVPKQYTVTINGEGPYGELPALTYLLDLDDLREVSAKRHGSLDDVAKAIRDLGSADRRRSPNTA